ncbi:glycosyltransferase family 2 protein [Parasedimentitalea psychrophila]|uniref:Glycosyltransferase n=1 Tax=Parasedimentitalea psychrophila TaxID=2997337 RepID=A0A9Y2L1T1_9RHOB|nr:glycosyltransferase [Parasedimentitalea psychrophila]WIY25992.1 glycosyltransferase [Parasedimentitalea psychrophila]
MPKASIIVPAFNATETLSETLKSMQNQSYQDFEVVVVNDGSTDRTADVIQPFLKDPRFHVVEQPNRGLAGARNTGIANAVGAYIGFCDADDLWLPDKLARHVRHLDRSPDVGLSYAGSILIDEESQPLGLKQTPRLHAITAAEVFKRNPVGNGSVAVFRRAALMDIAYRPQQHHPRQWFFDETFRQSEDIECWLRLALTTDWEIEGIAGHLTKYRIAGQGLSANTNKQFASWARMVDKLRPLNPSFFASHEPAARAYQLRYLARRAISAGDGGKASKYAHEFLRASLRPLFEEPLKTLTTLAAAEFLARTGYDPMRLAEALRH